MALVVGGRDEPPAPAGGKFIQKGLGEGMPPGLALNRVGWIQTYRHAADAQQFDQCIPVPCEVQFLSQHQATISY